MSRANSRDRRRGGLAGAGQHPIASVGIGASAAVGVVFGYVPARQAARLNPMDALRFE